MNIVFKNVLPVFIVALFAMVFTFGAVQHANAAWSSGGGSGSSTGTCCSTSNSGGSSSNGGGSSYTPPPTYNYPAPTCSLSVSPSQVAYGGNATITWSTHNAVSVYLSNFGSVNSSGSQTDSNLTYNRTYTLTATNQVGNTVTCTKTVTVQQPVAPTCAIYASPASVQSGQSVQLSWTSTNANYATLSSVGSVNTNGNTYVYPTQTTTYTLTVMGQNGQQSTCNAPVTVTTMQCPSGYTGTYPNCTVPQCPSGYTGTYPNCYPPVVYNAPTCSIYVNNNSYNYNNYNQYPYQYGQPVTITWSSQYGYSGWINNGVGSVALSGSQIIYPTQNTTYVLTVVGQNGQQVTCSVVVNLNTYVPPQPPIVYQNPAPYINLSAVPYTGLDLGPVGTVVYWGFLAAWCLLAAYLIAVKRVHMSIVRWYQKALFGIEAPSQTVSLAGLSSADMSKVANMIRASEPQAHAHAAPVAAPENDAVDPFILSQINRAK